MGQTVLITGASGGIGAAFAQVFARNGHRLVLVARDERRLNRVKAVLETRYHTEVTVLPADLTEEAAPKALYDALTDRGIQINILVNNAGFGDFAPFLDADYDKQLRMAKLNMLGIMRMTYVFGNAMRKQGYGRILNMASAAAFSSGSYMSVYYASKAFVLSFSQALYEELSGTGVTVTALCPGTVNTNFVKTAELEHGRLFHWVKNAEPMAVAQCGYRALMRGKPVRYHSWMTYAGNIGARIAPRALARKAAKLINGIPEKGKQPVITRLVSNIALTK